MSRALGYSAVVTVLLMLLEHFRWLPAAVTPWVMLALATPVQFWAGGRFYAGAWTALRAGFADMNTLIAVGTSAAYGYSLVATVFPSLLPAGARGHLYFETSAMIVTLILLGRLLEARARGRASEAIRRLAQLQAKTARDREGGRSKRFPSKTCVPETWCSSARGSVCRWTASSPKVGPRWTKAW